MSLAFNTPTKWGDTMVGLKRQDTGTTTRETHPDLVPNFQVTEKLFLDFFSGPVSRE